MPVERSPVFVVVAATKNGGFVADKLTVTVVQEKVDRFRATLKATTQDGSETFYGNADSAIGAVESGLDSIRNEKRRSPKGRQSKRYKIARSMVAKHVSMGK